VPQNLVWVCGDGVRGCDGVLTHRNRRDHRLDFPTVAAALLASVLTEVTECAASVKFDGWAETYYAETYYARR
jgi:hypothetical protein